MVKQSLIQQLDDAISQLIAHPSAPAPQATDGGSGGLPALMEVAMALRDLPRPEFKERLEKELGGKTSMSTSASAKLATPPLQKYEREGFHSLSAYLRVAHGVALIDFLKTAFGAIEGERTLNSDGSLMHGEVWIDGTLLEISDATPSAPPLPMDLILAVPDANEAYKRALAAGATSIYPPTSQTWGDLDAGVEDLSGNRWYVTTRRVLGHSPADQPAIVPGARARNAAQLITFYKNAFGADDSIRHDAPDGTVIHARLKFGDSYFAVGEERGEYRATTGTFRLFVPNVDEVYEQAIRSGATSIEPPKDKPYGERNSAVYDPAGNRWFIATHLDYAAKQSAHVSYIPKGFRTITPYLMVHHAEEFVDFMQRGLDAKVQLRVNTPDGKIMHSQILVGKSIIEVAEFNPAFAPATPITMVYVVDDADATYKRAIEAGVTSSWEPRTEPYGDRDAGVRDVAGNVWCFSTRRTAPHHPADETDVTPFVNIRGAAKYISFLEAAFEAKVHVRHDEPTGTIAHALVKVGDAYLGLSDGHGEWQPRPASFHIYVPDCDAAYERAIEAGATGDSKPADQPYGDRSAGVTDPAGNRWFIATHLRDWKATQ